MACAQTCVLPRPATRFLALLFPPSPSKKERNPGTAIATTITAHSEFNTPKLHAGHARATYLKGWMTRKCAASELAYMGTPTSSATTRMPLRILPLPQR